MDNSKFQELVLQQLQAMNEGQRKLEDKMGAIEDRIGAVEEGQYRLEDKMGVLEGKVGALEDRIGAVERGQYRLEDRISSIEENQQRLEIRMETEVINKVHVLFDAHELHEDKFKQVFNKLESIETDTGYLVTKVARLEQLVAK